MTLTELAPELGGAPEPRRPRSVLIVAVAVVLALALIGGLGAAILGFGGAAPDPALEIVTAPSPALSSPQLPREAAQGTSRSANRFSPSAVWVAQTAAAAGIPDAAVRAYATAQLRVDSEQPGCRLGWNTLAGIGWIESHHGTIGGRILGADGRSSTTVLGPALNGAGNVAAIPSTPASARWHGDPDWEHAVGPLQFLASSWDRWGADGDGDGAADPRDLDDAALAAARYLCADAHDLSSAEGWTAAVHSYNHDNAYVRNVANAATVYAQRASSGTGSTG